MTHWKAYHDGKITLKQARELHLLKITGQLKKYHAREKKLGIK